MADIRSITIKDIAFYERDVVLRMPFRFGIVTLHEAPQLIVRVTIENSAMQSAQGVSAEVLAPKWFDKNTDLSNEDNFNQLRASVKSAADLYLGSEAKTPFQMFMDNYHNQMDVAPDQQLVASFGQAVLDKAIIDAVCRLNGRSIQQTVNENILGVCAHPIIADVADVDFGDLVSALSMANTMNARHTVGLVDPITHNPQPVNDGLPETLEDVVRFYGHRYFKIKVGGSLDADIERLTEIAKVLDASETDYQISLDGNEQYANAENFLAFFERMENTPVLQQFCERIMFIEQPIARAEALSKNISAVSERCPVIIDESDCALDVFPKAMSLGYRGVSSKSCKGLYKSLINLARCRRAGAGYFLTAEDLTMQAGIGVQQDVAFISLLGLTHVERNGHHYVNGFSGTPEEEQRQYLEEHPGLYHEQDNRVRLKIIEGCLDISSLDCVGFASAVRPDFSTMRMVTY